MSALWFIAFTLIWTGLTWRGVLNYLSREPVPARFAHTIWRGAAILAFLPWIIAGVYVLIPTPMATPIPDLPYIGGAAEALSHKRAAVQAANDRVECYSFDWPASRWSFWWAVGSVRLGINALCQDPLAEYQDRWPRRTRRRQRRDLGARNWV